MPLDNRFFRETGVWHKTRKKMKRPVFIGIITGTIFLLFVSVTIFIVFDKRNSGGNPGDEQTGPVKVHGKTNFLLVCENSGETIDNIYLIVQMDMDSCRIKACAVPASLKITGGKFKETLDETYKSGTISKAAKAVESEYGIGIDRYMGISDVSFTKTMRELGQLSYKLSQDINYNSGGVNINISRNKGSFSGGEILNILNCNTWNGGKTEQYKMQGVITAEILYQHINETNLSKGESYVSTLLNRVDTDISLLDYNNFYNKLEAFAVSENRNDPYIIELYGTFDGDNIFTPSENSRQILKEEFSNQGA